MAEIVGTIASAITLASVFKACLNAFDIFHTAQHADLDVKRLLVRLNIERCRLYTWGEAMGVTKAPKSKEKSVLDRTPFRELVRDTLEAMEQLFQDSARIETRYGCKQVKRPFSQRKPTGLNPMDDLAASFSNFYVPGTSNMPPQSQHTKAISKVRWAIHDRKKFDVLIRELKDLVDGLQNITESIFATSRQGGMLRFGIQQIKNSDTLEIVSAACEVDYPDISDAATVKLDVMTVGTFQRDDVLDWLQEAEGGTSVITVPHPYPYGSGPGLGQDLNAIVSEYLGKKGYTDTLAVLVAESWAVEGKRAQVQPPSDSTGLKRKGDAVPDRSSDDKTDISTEKKRRTRSYR